MADATYTKRAVPQETRRVVARRLAGGGEPERCVIFCRYCGKEGAFWWPRRGDGQPGGWVHFTLDLDHLHPERHGGLGTPGNIDVACASCNRSKGARV